MGKLEAAGDRELPTPSPNSLALTVRLRELSREAQTGWIERLFSRLAALYGASFGRQWDGTNLEEVKATWAEKLGGFTAPQIGEALKSCDSRAYPPNLPEFIELCRGSSKRDEFKSLPSPVLSPEEIERRAKQAAEAISKPKSYDYRFWAKDLKRRYLAGEKLAPIQESMASEALGEVWSKGECMAMIGSKMNQEEPE